MRKRLVQDQVEPGHTNIPTPLFIAPLAPIERVKESRLGGRLRWDGGRVGEG